MPIGTSANIVHNDELPMFDNNELIFDDNEFPVFTDDSVETEALPDLSALRFLSEAATEQPMTSTKQKRGYTSLWSKYDEEGEGSEDNLPKTPVVRTPRKRSATKVPILKAAILHPIPVVTASETQSKKSEKQTALPSWPGPMDKVSPATLKAHTAAWKKRSAYKRWLSESKDIAADPTRCKDLYNYFEMQRLSLLKEMHDKEIHDKHVLEAPK